MFLPKHFVCFAMFWSYHFMLPVNYYGPANYITQQDD